MSSFWSDKRICVTGGAGFLGSAVVRSLQQRGGSHIFVPRSREFDLLERDAVRRMFDAASPDIVIHLAATVGGIGANRDNPGRFFYDNLMMGAQVIDEARLRKLGKLLCIGSVCAYPKFTNVPFKEEDLWKGFPEETNAPYGIAKRALLLQCQAYRQQYGLRSIFVIPTNLYGPGDSFDPNSSHVIPALIRKCIEAKERGDDSITVWGTGNASREFLYVDDCAEGIIAAAELYDKPDPINLGVGREITIRDLVRTIADVVGFSGKVVYDASKPDGQPRRMLDVARAECEFGFRARVDFEEGLRRTVVWYLSQRLSSAVGS